MLRTDEGTESRDATIRMREPSHVGCERTDEGTESRDATHGRGN